MTYSIEAWEKIAKESRVSIALSQVGQEGATTRIALGGSIDIGSAAELKVALQEGIARGKEIQVATKEVTDFDVTALQLLWAARREAQNAGLRFTLPPTGVLEESLAELGMEGSSLLAGSSADLAGDTKWARNRGPDVE